MNEAFSRDSPCFYQNFNFVSGTNIVTAFCDAFFLSFDNFRLALFFICNLMEVIPLETKKVLKHVHEAKTLENEFGRKLLVEKFSKGKIKRYRYVPS